MAIFLTQERLVAIAFSIVLKSASLPLGLFVV